MNIEYDDKQKRTMTATDQESIENSIGTIASTPYGAAPFIRSMGIKNYPPEVNSELPKNLYAAEVITQTGIWEDRARVEEVQVDRNNEVRVVLSNA